MRLPVSKSEITTAISVVTLLMLNLSPILPCTAFVPTIRTFPTTSSVSFPKSALSRIPNLNLNLNLSLNLNINLNIKIHRSVLSSSIDDDNFDDSTGEPSDYSPTDLAPTTKTATVDTDEDDAIIRDELKRELLLLASVTDRGAYATREENDIIVDLVTQLEALNPTVDPAGRCCWGEWDLCLTDTQVFRSSPFFQSVRAVFGGGEDRAIAENAFDLHEKATSVGRVGRVRQKVLEGKQIVSMVDLEVGVMPGMPFRVKGTVVTTADLEVLGPDTWEVTVKSTTVKGSNVPFLDQFLDDYPIEVPVGDIYGVIRGEIPVAVMKTFYVDEGIRITRDIDDNFYVFSRA